MNYKDRLKRYNEDRKKRNRTQASGSGSYLTDPTNPASVYYQTGYYGTGSDSSSSGCDSSSSSSSSSYDSGSSSSSSSSSSSDCGGGSYGE